IVVFDGDGDRKMCEPLRGMPRGQCIFTKYGTTADAVIVRLAGEARADGYDVDICSNDLEVRHGGAHYGAMHTPVAALAKELNAPDKYTARRLRHSTFVRRQLEDDGAEKPHPRKGNPRRAPKSQRGRGERHW